MLHHAATDCEEMTHLRPAMEEAVPWCQEGWETIRKSGAEPAYPEEAYGLAKAAGIVAKRNRAIAGYRNRETEEDMSPEEGSEEESDDSEE